MIDMKPTEKDAVYVLKRVTERESEKKQHPQLHLLLDEALSSYQLAKRPPNAGEPTKNLPRHEFERLYTTRYSEFALFKTRMEFEKKNYTSDPKEIAAIRACTFSISLLDYFPLQGELDEAAIDRISTKIISSVNGMDKTNAPQEKSWITALNQKSEIHFVENTSLYVLKNINGVPSAIAHNISGEVEAVAVAFIGANASFAKNAARFFGYMFDLSGAWIVHGDTYTLDSEFILIDEKVRENIEKRIKFYVNFISWFGTQKPTKPN